MDIATSSSATTAAYSMKNSSRRKQQQAGIRTSRRLVSTDSVGYLTVLDSAWHYKLQRSKDMMHHTKGILEAAERSASTGLTADCLRELRRLCLDEFALVMNGMPNERYPSLSSVLPAMAPVNVQQSWTGAAGMALLKQRVPFIEKIRRHFMEVTGRPLEGARILDYGCGYGMMLRLMYYLTDP